MDFFLEKQREGQFDFGNKLKHLTNRTGDKFFDPSSLFKFFDPSGKAWVL